MPIEIYHWNKLSPTLPGRFGARIPLQRWANNFGDFLGPMVVRWAAQLHGVNPSIDSKRSARLLSVGSVLHEAHDGDVIWGSGRNGLVPDVEHCFTTLDVRAVRGPLTKEFLESRGIAVPSIFGDPALLLPRVMPELREWARNKRYDATIVPNYQDLHRYAFRRSVLNPRSPVDICLKRIAESRFVVGSSLHALIVAESLGIPARAVKAVRDPEFKYLDYYAGTGRHTVRIANSVREAFQLGGAEPPDWSGDPLLDAFPVDLWR